MPHDANEAAAGRTQVTDGATRPGYGNPWLTLVAVSLGVMMATLDATVVQVANPVIAVELHTDLAQLQWVSNGYMLAVAASLITAGKLADWFGHKRVFLIGMVGFALASLLVGLAGSIDQLIAMRIVQGLFGAVLGPGSLAILRLTFPADKLKIAIAVWGAVGAFTMAAGPLVGGLVVNVLDWRWVFFLNLIVCGFGFVLAATVVRTTPLDRSGGTFDLPGAFLLTVTLFSLVLGIIEVPGRGWLSGFVLTCFAVAVVFGAAFVARESRTAHPLLPLGLFRSRALSAATVILTCIGFVAFSSSFYVVLYLQEVKGMTPLDAGLALLPFTAVGASFGPAIGGALNQKFGPRWPLVFGLPILAGGLFGLSWVTPQDSYNAVWPYLALVGLGMGMMIPSAIESVVGNAPKRLAGVASGLQETALMFGAALGIAVIGSLVSARVRDVLGTRLAEAGVPGNTAAEVAREAGPVAQGVVPLPEGTPETVAETARTAAHTAFTDGIQFAFVVSAIVAVVATSLTIFIHRPPQDDEEATAAPVSETEPGRAKPGE